MKQRSNLRIILQARTNSKRLPAKVLLPIGGLPLAILCAKRLSTLGHELVLATSNSSSDDYLSQLAIHSGIKIFRGELDDVLTRFIQCSQDMAEKDIIIRCTADNPLPDGDFIEKMLKLFNNLEQDYLGTSSPDDGLPYGLSAELFTVGFLRRHGTINNDQISREHVTISMRKEIGNTGILPKYSLLNKDYSKIRVTIDTLQDYLFLAEIFANIPCPVNIPWWYLIEKIFKKTHFSSNSNYQRTTKLWDNKCNIVLGTAQFGNKYGITNQFGCPDDAELCKIFTIAYKAGITYLDTARTYGISEKRIGDIIKYEKKFKIISKIQPLNNISKNSSIYEIKNYIDNSIFQSFIELKRYFIDIMMIHNFCDLMEWYNEILESLMIHVKNGNIGAIGVSVYNPEEAILCLQERRIKHIQIPFNLLDYRWINEEFLNHVKKRPDVTIHARSIFLQGLLLNEEKMWPYWVKNSKLIVDEINNLVIKFNRNGKIDLCMAYVRAFPWISYLVIGVENADQLQEIINISSNSPLSNIERDYIKNLFIDIPERLLNPSKW